MWTPAQFIQYFYCQHPTLKTSTLKFFSKAKRFPLKGFRLVENTFTSETFANDVVARWSLCYGVAFEHGLEVLSKKVGAIQFSSDLPIPLGDATKNDPLVEVLKVLDEKGEGKYSPKWKKIKKLGLTPQLASLLAFLYCMQANACHTEATQALSQTFGLQNCLAQAFYLAIQDADGNEPTEQILDRYAVFLADFWRAILYVLGSNPAKEEAYETLLKPLFEFLMQSGLYPRVLAHIQLEKVQVEEAVVGHSVEVCQKVLTQRLSNQLHKLTAPVDDAAYTRFIQRISASLEDVLYGRVDFEPDSLLDASLRLVIQPTTQHEANSNKYRNYLTKAFKEFDTKFHLALMPTSEKRTRQNSGRQPEVTQEKSGTHLVNETSNASTDLVSDVVKPTETSQVKTLQTTEKRSSKVPPPTQVTQARSSTPQVVSETNATQTRLPSEVTQGQKASVTADLQQSIAFLKREVPADIQAKIRFEVEVQNPYARHHSIDRHLQRSLGYILLVDQRFKNFSCFARLDSYFKRYVADDHKQAFPAYGATVLSNTDPSVQAHQLYVCDWTASDLRDWQGGNYATSIDFAALKAEGRMHDASTDGIFYVVYPQNASQSIDFKKQVFVNYSTDGAPLHRSVSLSNRRVLLCVKDRLYGPVTLREDGQKRPYVRWNQSPVIEGFKFDVTQPPWLNVNVYLPTAGEQVSMRCADVSLLKAYQFDLASDGELIDMFMKRGAFAQKYQNELRTLAASLEDYGPSNDDPFTTSRLNRLLALCFHGQIDHQYMDFFTALVKVYASSQKNPDEFWRANIERCLENQDLVERFESLPVTQSLIAQNQAQLDALQASIAELELQKRQAAERLQADLRAKQAQVEKEIASRCQTLAVIDDIASLQTSLTSLRTEVETLTRQKAELQAQDQHLEDYFEKVELRARSLAFDGMVASKFLHAAQSWQANEQTSHHHARAAAIHKIQAQPLTGEALANYLIQAIQKYRAYNRNMILNLWILLTQNFLTIFAGPPGVGKTSICTLLARVLGLMNVQEALAPNDQTLWDDTHDMERFVPVSVERGWTSKRDFVGYYNPLSKTFECADKRRYEAFLQLDAEKRTQKETLPFLMLLDEANLSPMEYYWADFMRLCDDHYSTRVVSFGGQRQFEIPASLRFVATINHDFTTENLSPRLLDRTFIVALPETLDDLDAPIPTQEVAHFPPIHWSQLTAYFGARDNVPQAPLLKTHLKAIYEAFSKIGIRVSQRTHGAMWRYVSTASQIMQAQSPASAMEVALDYAVLQKLLPHLNGNGQAYLDELEALQVWLTRQHYEMSANAVESIITRGQTQMGWYRYFS